MMNPTSVVDEVVTKYQSCTKPAATITQLYSAIRGSTINVINDAMLYADPLLTQAEVEYDYIMSTSYGPLLLISSSVIIVVSMILFVHRVRSRHLPTVYSQHLSPSHATQLPPLSACIDTTTPGPLHSVYECLNNPNSAFRAIVSRPYVTSWRFSLPIIGGHMQTMFTAFASDKMTATPLVTYARELLPVAAAHDFLHSGQVALDWCIIGASTRDDAARPGVRNFYESFTATTPTVLICHGLAGGAVEHYIKNVCYELSTNLGWRCVVFNARGCGNSKLVTPQMFCASYTDDLRQVVASLHSRLPNAPLIAIGYSLGANILTKFTGEEGLANRRAPFSAMAIVANPFDMIHGATWLAKGVVQRIYSRALAKNVVRLFKGHMQAIEAEANEAKKLNGLPKTKATNGHASPSPSSAIDSHDDTDHAAPAQTDLALNPLLQLTADELAFVYSSPTLRDFDKYLTSRAFGYATVGDYYRDASSSRFVKFISCPVLFINALDDPVAHHGAIPYDEICINPYATLITTHHGGHSMDWYEDARNGGAPTSWSARVIQAFVNDIVNRETGGAKTRSEDDDDDDKRYDIIMTPPPMVTIHASQSTDSFISTSPLSYSSFSSPSSPLPSLPSRSPSSYSSPSPYLSSLPIPPTSTSSSQSSSSQSPSLPSPSLSSTRSSIDAEIELHDRLTKMEAEMRRRQNATSEEGEI